MKSTPMSEGRPLGDAIKNAPPVIDESAAQRLREAWGQDWSSLSAAEADLLAGAAACSPFLGRFLTRDRRVVLDILRAPLDETLRLRCAAFSEAGGLSYADAMPAFRIAKREAAGALALADLAGAIDVMETARRLSEIADAAVEGALVASAAKSEAKTRGIASIAMGKLGARELNYSSDIDLVIVFDPAAMGVSAPEAKALAVRVAKDAVALLQNQTADGYVFRTDLRLRPDPGVSALALSVTTAEAYYESFGQNWERMAYIKARAHAGDIAVGEAFLKALRPFVWRKFLDYAAIEDVMAVKRQMHAAKGAPVDFEGRDIKTGRGGIREIEFYAQTQQVILGGKDSDLRARPTLDALNALAGAGHIGADQHGDLAAAYRYLRHVEHRLQMVNDEQTHRLPKTAPEMDRLARFAGEASTDALKARLTDVFARVEKHFDSLFRDETGAVEQPGPLVFTGVEADPETVKTLSDLGFQRAEEISATIRRWHAGGLRATRTERARVILTKLMAPLLSALSKSSDPDASFFAFDGFIAQLPAGVQIFSLLANNVALFDALIEILTVSPYLGREMSKRPNFIESLVEHGLAAPPPPLEQYDAEMAEATEICESYEEVLNAVRRTAGEARFFVAAKLAAGAVDASAAERHFTAIADAAVAAIAPAVIDEMRESHGPIDGSLAIVALGRLGAGQMTVSSDIDIMFIYEAGEGAVSEPPPGDGRALAGTEYFTRLVRRMVTALSAATEEGVLYEVDMALRPSGGAGPAAVSLSAFRRYYEEDAWIWEIMALTKARVIAGDGPFADKVSVEIKEILARPRALETVAAAAADMRRRLLEARPGIGPWDVKTTAGGLTDIAFLVQTLALVSAADHGRAPSRPDAAAQWFANIGALSTDDAAFLTDAYNRMNGVLHAVRAAIGAGGAPAQFGEALSRRLSGIIGARDIIAAEAELKAVQGRVAALCRQVLGQWPGLGG
ncbi:MAG: bifunctional [glutamine synthetase] adenylyltransferase/[glutamine synthetase]-adenylyl-L-tyrosine phosphorylase [Pseudomonadota bacterium]